ncbi:actin depolymerizing protein [Trematosphaeria pertusa]|uniref:Actin depolymerizing protein n=1 Tax=Trematosphaeria pertusa TaxID=390896 RepID=A0A6A6IYC6_9PLEO|nr:actin depolymerizing protein [Trematosphaeria pertusa]KAF2255308.1 actin depolymerizing protein [Trematosphaeria pertusa]
MPPHEGLVHPTEYDWRDSNVELVNSDIDHKVKYQSAATEPAWNNGVIGAEPGLYIWRIEDFEVVPWPKEKYGSFHEGDSYIILHSEKVKSKQKGDGEADSDAEKDKMVHDIFFWLGRHTTQDEAGTAAYKTVELDEFLHGTATQHRELQTAPSPAFAALFPRLSILRGGVRSGFTHVEPNEKPEHIDTLLRIFKSPAGGRDAILVHEVEPTWKSLDEDDVFVLDKGDKIFVWQGKRCAPMEKLKAAQVVNDLTVAKHVDVEVLSQSEARSKVFVDYLGGADVNPLETQFKAPRPVAAASEREMKKLFRLSDAEGGLSFELVKEGRGIGSGDLDGGDVFVLDAGKSIWVWEGRDASRQEKAMWIRVAQKYVAQQEDAASLEVAKVRQGSEGMAFWAAVEA